MPLQKLTFKPGVNRESTRYTNEGRWWDMDKVRFRSGTPEKIGGWAPAIRTTFRGVARLLHNWTTIGSENLLAVGTNIKMYIERGGALFDITPVRSSVAKTDPFTTGAAGSSIVTVTTTAVHGAIPGDFVTFSGASTTDGILAATLNAEFEILTTPTTTTFTIQATACTAGAVTGGGAVTLEFQVNTGPVISIFGVGYGVGGYGVDGYGLAAVGSPAVITSGMRQWVGWNFGQDFVFAIRDGGLFYWSTDYPLVTTALATRGVALSTLGDAATPVIADNVIVTDDEHVVVLGTNYAGLTTEDPMLVRWCAQGNPLVWAPAATNTAGDQRLTAGSYTYAVKKMRQENLIWTDTAVVSMQFVGPPVVFSFTTLADNVSIASTGAVAVAANTAYWMGKDKFYVYNGQVQTLPCDVRRYVFSDFNMEQIQQVFAGTNEPFNEVTWFYCSAASSSPDRYVTYNYLEQIWTFGTMERTAWLDAPLRTNPIAASADGYLYYHETGVDAVTVLGPTALTSYLESADSDIGDGDKFMFVERIIPDVDFEGSTASVPVVTLTLKARATPGANYLQTNARSAVQTAVVPFRQFTEMAWTRIRGRQMSFRIESNDLGVTWQLGSPRIGVREDGER